MSEQVPITSELSVDECRLMECGMWVNEEYPHGELDVNMKIELSDATPLSRPGADVPASSVTFRVHVDYSDQDGARIPRARMDLKLRGVVVGSGPDVDVLGKEARRVAASVLYPQAQAYMAIIAGTSPMGVPRLPTLSPDSVVDPLVNGGREGQ